MAQIPLTEKMTLKFHLWLVDECDEVLKRWTTLGDLQEEAAWVADSSKACTVRCTCPEFDLVDIAGRQTHLEKLVSVSQPYQLSSEVPHSEPHDAS